MVPRASIKKFFLSMDNSEKRVGWITKEYERDKDHQASKRQGIV